MSELHQVVCDDCEDWYDLNCGLVPNPQPPGTWTHDGASDFCPDCSEERRVTAAEGGQG